MFKVKLSEYAFYGHDLMIIIDFISTILIPHSVPKGIINTLFLLVGYLFTMAFS